MKIYKFGGTSVGTIERIKGITHIINNGEQNLVVLSAMSGTTNKLEEIAYNIDINQKEEARKLSKQLEEQYYTIVEQLYSDAQHRLLGNNVIETQFTYINNIINHAISPDSLKSVL